MSLTDAAAARVQEIIAGADKPIVGLRVGVKNGGCAGMSYTMEFAESAAANDEIVDDKGVRLLIDPKALLFLLGAQMDFRADKLSAGFIFLKPQRDLGVRLRRERGDHARFARNPRRWGLSGRRLGCGSPRAAVPGQPSSTKGSPATQRGAEESVLDLGGRRLGGRQRAQASAGNSARDPQAR